MKGIRSDCNKHRKDRCHYNANGTAKVGYNEPPKKKGFVAYKCPVCGRYHLGKMKTLISSGGELTPSICTASKNELVFILEAGHSESTPGKRSPDDKFREYKYNREILTRVGKELDKLGIKWINTVPEEKTEISLTERANRVNKICKQYGTENCIFISIHSNAAGNGKDWSTAKGWSIYTTPGKTGSDEVAAVFCEEAKKVCSRLGRQFRGHKEAAFTVIQKAVCKAVLVEEFFYDCREEMDWLLSEEGRYACTTIIVSAIKRLAAEA